MKISYYRRALVALFCLSFVSTPALLAAGNGFQFEIRRNATPEAYYVHILFRGAEPGDINTVPQSGAVLIRYAAANERKEQSDRGMRMFSSRQTMSSRVGVPPDGDLSRMKRYDKPGWILLVIPRN